MARTLTYAFRITHIDNIDYIEKCGFVRADSPLRDPAYVSIGDNCVIGLRGDRTVSGQSLSQFIPFYLGPRTPMLYVIQHGYNGVKKIDAMQIVYCVIRLDDIINSDIDCIFTDGHALSSVTRFFNKENLSRIDTIVKYDDVYSSFWANNDDLDLKRRKEAELLIKEDLSPRFVRGYIVNCENAKQRLEDLGIPTDKIIVRPSYYF